MSKKRADELFDLKIGEIKGAPTLSVKTKENTHYFLRFSSISPLMRQIIVERFKLATEKEKQVTGEVR